MPSRDANGNLVYSQGEYEHFNFMGEPFCGFVEGIGYACTEVIITTHTINTSGTHFINAIHSIQYLSMPPTTQNSQMTNKDMEQSIKDYLTQNGVYKDPVENKSYPMKQGSLVDVDISGDNVTITYKSSSNPNNVQIIKRRMTLEDLKRSASANGGFTDMDWVNSLNMNELREGSYMPENLETARKLRKVSSWAFSAEQMISPAVRFMERKIRQSAIKGLAPSSKYPVWIEKSILGKKLDSRVVLSPIKKLSSLNVSSQGLRTVSKALKYGGNVLGGVGLGFSAYDMYENGLNRNNGTQFVMGTLAIIPQTRIVGTVYFMGNFVLSLVGDNQIEDYVDDYTNQVIGKTMKKQLENSPPAGMYMWGNDGMWKY